MYQKGRAWIELNRAHLHHNVRLFQRILPKSCQLMPAIKANAYGHGAELIGKELHKMGITQYCVACAEEGVRLRQAGITGEILILGYTHPQDFERLRKYRLTQTVVDYTYGRELSAYGYPLRVHIGIDTGMHRLGEDSTHIDKIQKLWDLPGLCITGVFSHLCTSDGTNRKEQMFVKLQERRFLQVIKSLKKAQKTGFATHLQGSYGILNGNLLHGHYQYARAGIALYGALSESSALLSQKYPLKPVLSLKARIACIRELSEGEGAGYGLTWHADKRRLLAAVSIGYADGIPRTLSNKGHVLIKGEKAPVVGRVCMDQLLLDVTKIKGVQSKDEVVFIGKSGEKEIKVEEMAREAGTISNEILSGLSDRLCRMFV